MNTASPAHTPETTPARMTGTEGVLTLLALAAGGISSLLIVSASAGLAPMPELFRAVGVPPAPAP